MADQRNQRAPLDSTDRIFGGVCVVVIASAICWAGVRLDDLSARMRSVETTLTHQGSALDRLADRVQTIGDRVGGRRVAAEPPAGAGAPVASR